MGAGRMSDAQKQRMVISAGGKTRRDYERHAQRLLNETDCPLVMVYARSGGPSTETSFICTFPVTDAPPLAGWSPHCNGRFRGKVHTCALLTYIYRRFKACQEAEDVEGVRAISEKMHTLRLIQVQRKLYEHRVDGSIGWYEYVEPQLTQLSLKNI